MTARPGHPLDAVRLEELLRRMLLIREFDSRLAGLYTRGLIRGSSHPAIGQEAVAVGACAALRRGDYITSTHRGHGHAIAKDADPKRMMAELLGRSDGYCRGKGSSMPIADFSLGMLGTYGRARERPARQVRQGSRRVYRRDPEAGSRVSYVEGQRWRCLARVNATSSSASWAYLRRPPSTTAMR